MQVLFLCAFIRIIPLLEGFHLHRGYLLVPKDVLLLREWFSTTPIEPGSLTGIFSTWLVSRVEILFERHCGFPLVYR